jgi:hypothetical protein
MSLLVRTPKPHPTESLLGYVLRVSEENGYESPWHIMKHAGLTQKQMVTSGFPIDKLAAVLGRDAKELESISYFGTHGDGKRVYRILGHALGRSLPSNPLCLTKPKFCPHCVLEHKFIDAFWDLSFAVACPEHRCTLVNKCPSCGEAIGWFRQAISICKCGANLANAETESASDDLAGLMAIIQSKVHAIPLDSLVNSAGFPTHEFNKLSLHSLLTVIDRLGYHNLASYAQDSDDPAIRVQGAIEVLRNWPDGFHQFMRRLDQRQDESQLTSVGLRKRFESLYYSLFKRHTQLEGIEFLHREFIRFGLQEWGEGVVDKKLLRDEAANKRFVSQSEQAVRLGVRPITLRRWGEKGIVPVKFVSIGNLKRYVVDSNAIDMVNGAGGKTLGERHAAACIGLPVSVLKSLRQSGHYQVKHLPSRLKAFHEYDLNTFKDAVLALGETVAVIPTGSISLREVMRLKFRSEDGKADFMRTVLSNKIRVIGIMASDAKDILFSKEEVLAYLKIKRTG